MTVEKETAISFDKKNMASRCVGQVVLSILLALFIEFAFADMHDMVVSVILTLVLFTTVSALIFNSSKLFDNKPGLVITPSGIIDNTPGASVGKIEWADIRRIYVSKNSSRFSTTPFLAIDVQDPQKYLGRGNFLARTFRRLNYSLLRSPIFISDVSLQISFDEMVKLVQHSYQTYGHA